VNDIYSARYIGLFIEGVSGRLPLSHVCRHAPQHHGRTHIDRPSGRPYERRPSGLRTGSPPSPPPRLIRPTVRLLPRSPRLSGPGPLYRPHRSGPRDTQHGVRPRLRQSRKFFGTRLESHRDAVRGIAQPWHCQSSFRGSQRLEQGRDGRSRRTSQRS
jgi:hypothetical protein